MILYTVIDALDVFPYDYSKLDVREIKIPYGVIQKTMLPENTCVSTIISTDQRIYLPSLKTDSKKFERRI